MLRTPVRARRIRDRQCLFHANGSRPVSAAMSVMSVRRSTATSSRVDATPSGYAECARRDIGRRCRSRRRRASPSSRGPRFRRSASSRESRAAAAGRSRRGCGRRASARPIRERERAVLLAQRIQPEKYENHEREQAGALPTTRTAQPRVQRRSRALGEREAVVRHARQVDEGERAENEAMGQRCAASGALASPAPRPRRSAGRAMRSSRWGV